MLRSLCFTLVATAVVLSTGCACRRHNCCSPCNSCCTSCCMSPVSYNEPAVLKPIPAKALTEAHFTTAEAR